MPILMCEKLYINPNYRAPYITGHNMVDLKDVMLFFWPLAEATEIRRLDSGWATI